RGPWSSSEDQALLAVVAQYQGRAWARVASELRSSYNVFRSAKQCRERYVNNLSPHIEKRPWTQDEDWAIIRGWQTLGRSWSKIARMLEGRSDNDVKNRWNT
ncbi:C-Myb R2r3, partial [Atractiella rhizophila]